MYPQEVEKLPLMDAFLPGVGDWRAGYYNRGIWHFRFYGPTPEALVKSRERTYFEHFWNDFAADKTRSIPEVDRRAYTEAYARPNRMAAGFSYFASFQKTATDFAELAKTKLAIPVLSIGGAKANSVALGAQAKLVASDVKVIALEDNGSLDYGRAPEGDHGCACRVPPVNALAMTDTDIQAWYSVFARSRS